MNTHHVRLTRPGWRRVTAVAGALALAGTALVTGAPTAAGATQQVTGASFTWGLQDYIQFTGTGAPGTCHYLSAGSLDGTSATATQNSYKAEDGNVAVRLGAEGAPAPTWTTKCSGFGVITSGSTTTGNPGNQRVVWSGGAGTRNSITGAATISFLGTVSMKFSGAPYRIVDPVLTVDAAGIGTMKATIKAGANPAATVDTPNVTVAELSGVSVGNATGFVTTPTFAGRTITVNGVSQPTQVAKDAYDALGPNRWGAWPESFVVAANSGAVNAGGRYYSSAPTTTGDDLKDPLPITVSYGSLGAGAEGQSLNLTIPQGDCGELVWSIQDGADGAVVMTEATLQSGHLLSTGTIDPISITDNRNEAGTCEVQPFTISGAVSDFAGSAGAAPLPGNFLGWTPTASAGWITPGPVVPSGFGDPMGEGLSEPAPLATVGGGTPGTGDAGASLEMKAPLDAEPGAYSATLTLTGLS